MRKISYKGKVRLATNVILAALLIAVFAISFFPQKGYPIFGRNENGAYYGGNEENGGISLMFNVYSDTESVKGILDKLMERGIKATFFLGGCWVDDNRETVERMAAEGHEIANHGYFHKDHSKLTYDKNQEEIVVTEKLIKGMCGVTTRLFAPPSGAFSATTVSVCDNLGYKVIMWSKDTIDWRDKDSDLVYERATKNAVAGDLVLMHPTPHTLSALDKILDYYEAEGLKVMTVSENLSE